MHTPLRFISFRNARRTIAALAIALSASFITGCGSTTIARTFTVPAGQYPTAIEAARDELRAAGYTLERVDAVAGEILTAPKTVAGLATPLAPENRWIAGVAADTLSNRPRTVRVRFRDAQDIASPPIEGRAVVAEIDAVIWKKLRPGWRLETETTIRNLYWTDPALSKRGVTGATVVPLKRDNVFATELTKKIAKRMKSLAQSNP